jgi:hypothetical protein
MSARDAASVATFSSCRRTSRFFGSPRARKAGFGSCEQAQGRPVERGPSACNHGDEMLVYEARCGHRNRFTFAFRKRQPSQEPLKVPSAAFPFAALHEVNERCIELLVNEARAEKRPPIPLVIPLRELFRNTGAEARRRAGQRGLLLIDMEFQDAESWRAVRTQPELPGGTESCRRFKA